MGVNVLDRIYKASEMSGDIKDIVVFTESFKCYGTIVKDHKDNLKDILTFKRCNYLPSF